MLYWSLLLKEIMSVSFIFSPLGMVTTIQKVVGEKKKKKLAK